MKAPLLGVEYHTQTTPTRCISSSDMDCIMEDCSATQYELIHSNPSYRNLQTSSLNFVGTQPCPFSTAKVPLQWHE